MNKNDVFVKHIEKHLKELGLKDVICKICGKTIDEIYEDERNECEDESEEWWALKQHKYMSKK